MAPRIARATLPDRTEFCAFRACDAREVGSRRRLREPSNMLRDLGIALVTLAMLSCSGGDFDLAEVDGDASAPSDSQAAPDVGDDGDEPTDAGTAPGDASVGDVTVPDTSAADTAKADTAKADTGKPDAFVADAGKADTAVADTGNPDAFVGDTSKPDAVVPDTSIPDGPIGVGDSIAIGDDGAVTVKDGGAGGDPCGSVTCPAGSVCCPKTGACYAAACLACCMP
jgi:hypothetical protein